MREEALRLDAHGSAWFSHGDDRKGTLEVGHYADLAVLSDDCFAVDADAICGIEGVLTTVGGRVAYDRDEKTAIDAELPPVSPRWSPVATVAGYDDTQPMPPAQLRHVHVMAADGRIWETGCGCGV